MNDDGGSQVRLTNNPSVDDYPGWSPDGSRVVFQSDRDGDVEIFVMDSDGSNVIQLTNNTYTDSQPRWSPDNSKIAFTSNRDGNAEIYVMNTDGSSQTRVTNNSVADNYPAWSPDGMLLADIADFGSLVIRDLNGNILRTLISGSATSFAFSYDWSQDGSKFVYAFNNGLGPGSVTGHTISLNGVDAILCGTFSLSNAPSQFNWSPDGSQFVAKVFVLAPGLYKGCNGTPVLSDSTDSSPDWR